MTAGLRHGQRARRPARLEPPHPGRRAVQSAGWLDLRFGGGTDRPEVSRLLYLTHDPGVRFSLEAAPFPWEEPDPARSETERDSEVELLPLSAEIEPRLERGAFQDRVTERYAQLRDRQQGGGILEADPPRDVEFERP